MAVDLEAIARRGRCDVSSLKLALPLLEQGYEAPFLARYRKDELGGLDESTLWSLKAALESEQAIAGYRDQLYESWKATPLADPAIGDAIRKSGSNRTLQRLGKRLRKETASGVDSDANRLAVRMLNPQKDDPGDPRAVADLIEPISDPDAAVAGLADTIPARLAGDPRVISAAVRWLSRNAKLHISNVHDPHGNAGDHSEDKQGGGEKSAKKKSAEKELGEKETGSQKNEENVSQAEASDQATEASDQAAEPSDQVTDPTGQAEETGKAEANGPSESPEKPESTDASAEETSSDRGEAATTAEALPTADNTATESEAETKSEAEPKSEAESKSEAGSKSEEALPGFEPDPEAQAEAEKKKKAVSQPPKKQRKISPRQRRRRWLVSVLKPLEGKRLPASKLSAFQIVMLGRALRSQVAVCAFEYDAAKLVHEIKRTVVGLNKSIESMLGDFVMQHEADIREAAEAAWWDELHERASTRLVAVVADQLRCHVNRGPVDAKVVMSIDAVGPKTAATAIVSSDGKVLHGEDLPCQLSATARIQTVTKMGELIHQYGVDLVIVSNGPARRACLIALGELIDQSPSDSIRWTVADRSGADTYSSGDVANSEMRSTPRRFRSAAWIAFSVLHPAQAFAKIDPLRLRLSSFQSELSDDALAISLGHIISSGASRGGVDANVAPQGWLEQLPGMNHHIAGELISRREDALLQSRDQLLELKSWESAVQSRQALPFLRVFDSAEVLDGTLIHPDDYGLAKKLASALEIELPPPAPPGYESPSYEKAAEIAEPKLVDATHPATPAPVEEFDNVGEKAGEFKIGEVAADEPAGDAESAANPPSDDANAGELAASEAAAKPATPETATEDGPGEQAAADAETAETTPEQAAAEPAAGDGDTTADSESPDTEPAEPADSAAAEQPAVSPPSVPDPIRRPRPEQSKIDKCIKEWQVGPHRTNQLVDWLCDPFGETAISDDPPAVLSTMPTLKTLKPGDQVIGVVVGVMSFGVFVELAPDCSGLIHVSRLSDGYVEDLNEAVQVGDVVTAWVTGIDEKRRRVGLSALSPEQEAKLQQERENRDSRGGRGGRGGRGKQGGAGQAERGRGGKGKPATQAGPGRGQPSGGRGGGDRGGRGRRGGGGPGRGGRSGDRGGRKRQPESYRVTAKPEAKPISDAMQKGEEPLRSFGDLLQYYSKQSEPGDSQQKPPKKDQPKAKQTSDAPPEPPKPAAESDSQSAGESPAAAENAPRPSDTDAPAKTDENPTGATE